MMKYKRVTLLCGHYGSGKTNIAVNLALEMKKTVERLSVADLDIVNPYFRTKDSQDELEEAGIRFIGSKYANSNLDIPALPPELYSITDDRTQYAVVDVGGDDRGAVALGRFVPALLEEGDYEFMAVVNMYRPLTADASGTVQILREIEAACGMKFTGIVNNSNIGPETIADTVVASLGYAEEISAEMCIPVLMTTVEKRLYPELSARIEDLFPLTLQSKIW